MNAAPPLLRALSLVLAEASGDEAAALRSAVDRVIAGDEDSLDAAFGCFLPQAAGTGARSQPRINATT
ncbi:hypothetical protein I6F11_29765 [Ensifer sp. NBAIM29]|nr:hypothetical protein [Ensifer sp. NBAIM29]